MLTLQESFAKVQRNLLPVGISFVLQMANLQRQAEACPTRDCKREVFTVE
jgi:hypothetical protein